MAGVSLQPGFNFSSLPLGKLVQSWQFNSVEGD